MERTYITIGRQFGSGGREVGKKVAQALGIPYYDKELLAVAAKESGLSHQFLQAYDERPTNSFFYSLVMGQQNLLVGAQNVTVEQLAAKAQRDAVQSVADKGSCVIVGRCADYLLREREGLLRVFICADWDKRIDRVCRRDGLGQKEAEEKLRRMDKTRAAYYSFHTDRKWGAAETYDLCINSSRKGPDATADLILSFIRG
ncbi:MAG: AAA family ATPase [Oscillospiraceae bacterium]|jgi:cytidylate kinase